jgi:hypothetical protein
LEAATALGLNVVKVALLEDKADQSQMSEDTVTLYVDHLDHDLAQEVLPRLRRKYRKPLQVQRGFLKILIAVLSVLFLLLVMLVSIIAIVVYLIVSWFIHLVAGILSGEWWSGGLVSGGVVSGGVVSGGLVSGEW